MTAKKRIILSWIHLSVSVVLFVIAFMRHYNPVEPSKGVDSVIFPIAFLLTDIPCAVSSCKAIRKRMIGTNGVRKLFAMSAAVLLFLLFSYFIAASYTVFMSIRTAADTVQYLRRCHRRHRKAENGRDGTKASETGIPDGTGFSEKIGDVADCE